MHLTPLDHLRLWYVGLDREAQFDLAFSLGAALIEDLRGRRLRSERDFIAALEAWLAPGGFAPRMIGKALSFAAVLEHVYADTPDPARRAVWERIRPEWRSLRARHLNRETVAEWSAAMMGEAAPARRAAVH
ncbi:MAG TPA: hypothetical protein VGU45_06635 [Microvirga sp.]|jgi:hypothetical protein|nr:hypothetical protein [Microvirga sp.]